MDKWTYGIHCCADTIEWDRGLLVAQTTAAKWVQSRFSQNSSDLETNLYFSSRKGAKQRSVLKTSERYICSIQNCENISQIKWLRPKLGNEVCQVRKVERSTNWVAAKHSDFWKFLPPGCAKLSHTWLSPTCICVFHFSHNLYFSNRLWLFHMRHIDRYPDVNIKTS